MWRTVTNTVPPLEYYDRLVAMYSERQRHYHDLRHIADCLREFDSARQLAREPVAVELAIWFHDAVYDPRAGDNEERSAELAKHWLSKLNVPDVLVAAVPLLVLATKSHDGSIHVDAPLLVDVDLSVLGQPRDRFWEYEAQIRAEYAWVEQKIFAAKRAEILARFLARARIYSTDVFFEKYERQARLNLRASILKLRAGSQP